MSITGYRTNEDGTQTLAWTEREDGTVFCIHSATSACHNCTDADERLARSGGMDERDSVRVGYWPAYMVRDGQTVTFDYSRV